MAEEISVLEFAGTPIAELDRYSGDSQEYKEVVSWTVPDGEVGVLFEVSMISDNYSKTHFKLTIAGVEQFSDKTIQTALTLPWKSNKLVPGSEVKLEARSTEEGISIVVDGSITGKTLGED